MSTRVTLKVIRGPLAGKSFVFEERTTCIVGRAPDCNAYVPTPKGQQTISRHHCLLDINPPDVRIRDFGSMNGTILNGQKIGQREKGQEPGDVDLSQLREHDLKDGDKIRMGGTVMRVRIHAPTIREDYLAEPGPPRDAPVNLAPPTAVHAKAAARAVPERQTQMEPAEADSVPPPEQVDPAALASTLDPVPVGTKCARCGRDVSREVSKARSGEYICAACRSDPFELMKQLLRRASAGDKDLVAIRGYELMRELGQGGMGAVYLARQDKTGQQIALKIMLPKVAASPRATEAFLRESYNTQALQHQHVVRLHETGCTHGMFFFTLEYCDGGSVDRLMKDRDGPLTIAKSGRIILQALEGLAYAHSAKIPYVKLKDGNIVQGTGLVHRDVKPANLFLCGSGDATVAKLGDYGLAKAFDLAGLSGHTYTGDVAGTPHYMPRQQVLNFRDCGPEVDVWAMAATLYAMLTGHVPRDFSKKQDAWQTVLQAEPVPIRDRNAAIPKKLAAVIDHALRDKPEIGFRTANEFKQALEQVL